MTINDAFEILKVDPFASVDEIKSAYHKISKQNHPDISMEENEEKQKLINEANEVAMAYVKVRNSLIPISISNDVLATIQKNIAATNYRADTQSYIKSIQVSKTTSLQRVKYFLWVLTAVLAFITFFGKEFIPGIIDQKKIPATLKLMPLISGCLALFFQLMLDNIKNKLELINESFQDKNLCAKKLSEYLQFQPIKSFLVTDLFSKNEIHDNPVSLVKIILGQISYNERIKILILKAKENGLIEPLNAKEINPKSLNEYILNFNPTAFGQMEEKKEIKVRTAQEIRQSLKSSIIAFAIFAVVTGFVIIYFKSYWAFLPGFFTFIMTTLIISERKDLVELNLKSVSSDI